MVAPNEDRIDEKVPGVAVMEMREREFA